MLRRANPFLESGVSRCTFVALARAVPAVALVSLVAAQWTPPPAGRLSLLSLQNTQWNSVRVNVRMGASTGCPGNPEVGTRLIKPTHTRTAPPPPPLLSPPH